MSNNSQFISPLEAAKRVCVMHGDTSFQRLARVMVALGQACDDVGSNLIPHVRSEFVKVSSNLTAPIPNGAGKIIKVGMVNDHGQIVHLYENSLLRTNAYNKLVAKGENCSVDAADVAGSIITKAIPNDYYPGDYFHNCTYGAGSYGELYGFRFDPASIGTWRVDEVAGRIEFGSGAFVQAGRYVLVEFKDMSSGRFATVPAEAFPVIEARTRYYLNPGSNAGRVASMDFEREYRQLKRLWLRKPLLDYLRAIGDDTWSPSVATSSDLSFASSSSSSSSSSSTTTNFSNLNYYTGDTAAIADGLQPGDEYFLSAGNDYDLPKGLRKVVYNGPS